MTGLLQKLAFILGIILFSSQSFAKSIEIIVPYSAGGATDILARKIENVLGNNVYVVNKPGASSNIGFQYFVDCKTACLLIAGPNIITNKNYFNEIYPKDILNSRMVYLFGEIPYVLVTHKDINSIEDLLKREIKVGHGGIGSNSYFGYLALCKLTKCLEVPYKSASLSIAELASKEIDAYVHDGRLIEQFEKMGKLNVIASLSENPDKIKTARQLGYDIVVESWWALFARNMSDADVKSIRLKLSTIDFDMRHINKDPDVFWQEKKND